MTASNPSLSKPDSQEQSSLSRFIDNMPGARFLKNLNIGVRLLIGFGIMVVITLLGASASYLSSTRAADSINNTVDFRMPVALAASSAQADLLRMIGDVRGYLALGDQEFRTSYLQSRDAFERDLAALTQLSPNLDETNREKFNQLKAIYDQWAESPEQLFELRDDQLEREPAYKMLATDGVKKAGTVLIGVQTLIETQADREPSSENMVLLKDMANFEGSFAAMLSGLRGYVTTRNRIFRGEYEANLDLNEIAWERLNDDQPNLTADQQVIFADIVKNRQEFLALPNRIFETLEGPRWREDLYLFRTETIPATDTMQQLLTEITLNQQDRLVTELAAGRAGLTNANRQTLFGGIAALLLGLVLAYVFRENIAGPVRRLTGVAEQIRTGDLEARARIEATDEIGILAGTFNNMTSQLRQTLSQVRKEKKRADDLLHVVIPIGVELSSEKNFNRLLENMLLEAKKFCHADAGIVYLKDNDRLKFVIVRNDALKIAMGGTVDKDITFSRLPMIMPVYDDQTTPGAKHQSIAAHAVSAGETLNIADAYQLDPLNTYGPGVFDEKADYRSISYLTIPLKNSQNEVLGVLQLINAQDPETGQIIPFDPNLQQMMESFSSLAVAALEAYIREQGLKQEIQQLRIEIDEAKRQKQVSEIVDTDFFQDLQAKARTMRSRRSGAPPADTPPAKEEPKS
jgi:CHASE3 domain sensor protein/GAF domain-containing protein